MAELKKRGFKIKSEDNFLNYFSEEEIAKARNVKVEFGNPFPKHHNDRYLRQCFYNLEEKYDRGQKDFSQLRYQAVSYYLKEMGVIK